jgi:hypothetical protein
MLRTQMRNVDVPLHWLLTALVVCAAALVAGNESARVDRRPDALTVRSTVVRSVQEHARRQQVGPRTSDPGAVAAAGEANAWFVVESADADFGEMLPETARELRGAFVLRVHSDRDWELRLVPTGDLEVTGTADRVPLDRLAWRASASGGFEPFRSTAGVTVARGGPTGGAGEVVILDLRLELSDRDTLGRYAVGFRAVLEVR